MHKRAEAVEKELLARSAATLPTAPWEAYRKFTGLVLFDFCEDWGDDLPGDQIIDYLEAAGLVKKTTVSGPCGGGDPVQCNCAEVGAEFPTECYRLVPDANLAKSDLPPQAGAVDSTGGQDGRG